VTGNDDLLTEVGTLAMKLYGEQHHAPHDVSWEVLAEEHRVEWRKAAREMIVKSEFCGPAAPDPIRPAHYKHGDAYEALRVMLEWHGVEPVVSFCQLTAEKYLARAGKKEGEPRERDYRKAAFYLTHAAELLEKKP
jgi:hypothetical protein